MPLGYAGLTWSSNLGKSGIGSSGLSGSPTFGLTDIQHDPMTVGIYQPQIWGGADQLVRRNLLLNTATLATQNVTTLGLSYTLYLKGTGSVTLSGTATGTLNGTGAGNRVSLQFTATAGTLTLTVSGSVTEGHLTRTATTDHSYQAVTDWTTEVFQYNAQRQLPWLRRNALKFTDAADNSGYWTTFQGFLPFGSGSVVNAATIPGESSATADLIVESTSNDYRQFARLLNSANTFNIIAGVTYTASVVVKLGTASNRTNVHLRLDVGTVKVATFNLVTGLIVYTDPYYSGSSIESLGNGWFRISVTKTSDSSFFYYTLMSHSASPYVGDGVSGLYVGRMQLEVSTSMSAYQPIGSDWPSTYTALAQAAGYPISLYSDRAGTIAVDSPETVVGIELDLSRGLVSGTELVANGGFDSDTVWVKGTGWSITGGQAVASSAAAGTGIYQNSGLVSGKTYLLTVDLTITSGRVRCILGNSGALVVDATVSGRYTGIGIAGTGGIVYINAYNVSLTGSVDNVSVREIPGNHLVAPSDAARPLLKRDGNGNFYLLRDLVDDSLNVTLPNYGSNCVHYRSTDKLVLKDSAITLNGATAFSVPSVDYGRILLSGPSNNDYKIQKYLGSLATVSAPAVLGVNLVINGDGTSLTGWSTAADPGCTVEVTGGEFHLVSNGGTTYMRLVGLTTVGKYYRIAFDYRLISGTFKTSFGGTAEWVVGSAGAGRVDVMRLADGTVPYFSRGASGSACEFYLDNIVIQEVLS